MNKAIKIIAWVLGLIGLALGAWCLASGDATNETPVNFLLRYTYVLFIAAVVILLGLAIAKAAANNPKSLIKALIFLVIAVAVVFGIYALSAGNPAVKGTATTQWLKITDTMMILTAALGVAAVLAIVFGAVRSAITK